jgi:hypothetical protein
LQLVRFARLHSYSPVAACISPRRKQRGIGLSRNRFNRSIFCFVNADACITAKFDETRCASAKQSCKSRALESSRPKRTPVYSLAFHEFDLLQYFSFRSCSLFLASVLERLQRLADFEREGKVRNLSMPHFRFQFMRSLSLEWEIARKTSDILGFAIKNS